MRILPDLTFRNLLCLAAGFGAIAAVFWNVGTHGVDFAPTGGLLLLAWICYEPVSLGRSESGGAEEDGDDGQEEVENLRSAEAFLAKLKTAVFDACVPHGEDISADARAALAMLSLPDDLDPSYWDSDERGKITAQIRAGLEISFAPKAAGANEPERVAAARRSCEIVLKSAEI